MKPDRKIVMLTAYSFSFAKLIDGLVDIILVGDSLGNTMLGFESTQSVSMEDMLRHTSAVRRGVEKSMIVADMPYLSDATEEVALSNARALIDAGAHAVKIEGKPHIAERLAAEKIKTMGHIGLLPQTAVDTRVKGRDEEEGARLLDEALRLEKAGVFAIVMEMVSSSLSKKITQALSIPTIGIGSGADCDGQVLVIDDMLGISPPPSYKFVKRYADLYATIKDAVNAYATETRNGTFPDEAHSFK